ncbi:MAG: UDP-N-acetylmuramoyl-tripeptide--D-alanyl-D-alanine ligase [Betaproteobacteria bacterium]|nr:UDP-N-acetylmuramoyl-tripeptide--D-alanyl-D-alanine ligase [Betaproteobacteria bacterium]
MMAMDEAARLLGAAGPVGTDVFLRVATDSRALQAGDLFVALRGERFDGHAFVAQVLEAGAVGAIVSEPVPGLESSPKLIRVSDTAAALSALAAAWRLRINPRVVAVTGSNGKTSVKEMLASILLCAAERAGDDPQATVLATAGNLNNTLGLPMTLLRLRPGHRWAVVEMGMNHPGEIAAMTRVAKPDVALVNNVQRAHLGLLGSIEAVARAKGEIYEGLGAEGVALIPAADPMAPVLRASATGHRCIEFALDPANESFSGIQGRTLAATGGLEILLPSGTIQVRLGVPGRHSMANAVAAAAAAQALGIDALAIQAGLERFQGVPGRLQPRFSARGALVLDDTYNANPDSVAAAVAVLVARPGRRILVLGDLGELGEGAAALHAEVGVRSREAGVDDCFTLGDLARETSRAFGLQGRHFDSVEALVATLKPQLNADATVLVKGSRFMQMERVVEGLVQ